MESSWIWTGVFIYVVFALYIAYLSRHDKQGTMVGYFLGNRQMGGFVSALSYSATTYSAFMLIGLAGLRSEERKCCSYSYNRPSCR